jgi:hypothetical protein
VRGRPVSLPAVWLRGTGGLSGLHAGLLLGEAGEDAGKDSSAHEDTGTAAQAYPLRALLGVRARIARALAGVDLLEGLVAITPRTVPKRLRHRGAP